MNSYVHVGWNRRCALIDHDDEHIFKDEMVLPVNIRKLILFQTTLSVDRIIIGLMKK